MKDDFMTIIKWLSNIPLDDGRWHQLIENCWRMLRSSIAFNFSHAF